MRTDMMKPRAEFCSCFVKLPTAWHKKTHHSGYVGTQNTGFRRTGPSMPEFPGENTTVFFPLVYAYKNFQHKINYDSTKIWTQIQIRLHFKSAISEGLLYLAGCPDTNSFSMRWISSLDQARQAIYTCGQPCIRARYMLLSLDCAVVL